MQRIKDATRCIRPRVVFSGIQPTGIPHLGNYIGAIRQWEILQRQEPTDTKLIYSIVDLHAITTLKAPEKLKRWKRESLASLLAAGIDPERCTLFYQSSVPAHSELMWILACTASVGYLSRMTQWKQKLSSAQTEDMNKLPIENRLKLGLFSYPVLQAADILVHRATHVPVGHDQNQHLEFARECATNFNHAYGAHLVHPQTMSPPVHRVMSLSDPTSKMSKSHKLARSRVLITDSADEIQAKVSSALTDSMPGISYDPTARPGVSNLLSILSIFDTEKRSPEMLGKAYSTTHPRVFKEMVADAVILGLQGIRNRYLELIDGDNRYLDHVEEEGARRARLNAEETMSLIRSAVGL